MWVHFWTLYSRGPQPPGRRPVRQTGTGLWPVRNRATQQEVSSGRARKLHLLLAPDCSHYHLNHRLHYRLNHCSHYCLKHCRHCSHYCLNHPPTSVHGRIVFHETGPWCQKDWVLLFFSVPLIYVSAFVAVPRCFDYCSFVL